MEIIKTVAMPPSELDKLSCSLDDGTTLGSPRNRDASTATELEKSFVPKELQRTQHGVLVYPEDCGKVLGRRQALTWLGLTVR